MPDNNLCLSCKFANWKKAKGGRLHPDGYGTCAWSIRSVPIPSVYRWPNLYHGNILFGGDIHRKTGNVTDCPTYKGLLF